MSHKTNPQGAATLKQLTFRISSTPVAQLPRVAAQVSASLWACRDLLSSTAPSTKQNSEDGVTVHRFKTQLSTLLQDRTIEGRWSAVVLVKATIEAGGLEIVSKANGWVKSLLAFLKKPDPSTTRSLAIITLVRIFMLTWDHANLVREITTPSLPAFISSCLSNIENKRCSSSEMQTVLEALITILPRHPTVFRTHENNMRAILNKIISSTATSTGLHHYAPSHIQAAQKALVLLHHCAPKQGASEKWDDTLKATVAATHATCDRVFRSVIEDWRSVAGVQPSLPAQQLVAAAEAELESLDVVGMSPWKGIYHGSERIISLLGLLQAHLNNATANSATIRIGLITDLTTRLLSVTIPASGKQEFVKPNHQVSRDERDAMYSVLPQIHIATLELLDSALHRFGHGLVPILPSLTEQLIAVFKGERADEDLRATAYLFLNHLLKLVGPTFGKDEIADIAPFIAACCYDLLPEDDRSRLPTSTNGAQQSGSQAATQNTRSMPTNTALQEAAFALLPTLLSTLSPASFPRKLRASVDRTAILTRHKDALVASVLNPPVNPSGTSAQASLLPFLARLFPGDPEVEAIIRPRMPVTWTGRRNGAASHDEEEEEEDEEEDASMRDAAEAQADEPDLLASLDEHLGNNNDRSDASPESSVNAAKRPAPSAPEEPSIAAKRLRASPIAESLAQATPQELPGPDPVTASAAVPTTVVTRPKEQQTVTLPASATAENAGAGYEDDEDDGSDFEMPPLTMESSGEEDEGDE